jgi:hypothetical protein
MAEQLVPDEFWRPSRRCCRPSDPIPRAVGPGSRTEPCWAASSMCCAPGCLAAAARLRSGLRQPGDVLAAAAGLAAGRRCIFGCWSGWVTTARSTGRGQPSIRSVFGPGVGDLTGANPVDRGKPGSKYHLLIDATGIPLAVGLSAANTHDSQLLEPLVDAVPVVIGPRGRPGRPRRRPAKLHASLGLRLPDLPADHAPPRHHSADCPPWGGVRSAAGSPPVEGRTVTGLAVGQPTPDRPL